MRDDWESFRSFIMWLAALPGETSGTWLNETYWFRTLVSALPAPAARLFANIQTTGKDGGHDLHYPTFRAMGVDLVGRLAGTRCATRRGGSAAISGAAAPQAH
jgi:hypothetical protein